MLILTRRKNEQILIGEQIQITVIAIRGKHVQIGIEAPRQITVKRQESPRLRNGSTAALPPRRQLLLPFPED